MVFSSDGFGTSPSKCIETFLMRVINERSAMNDNSNAWHLIDPSYSLWVLYNVSEQYVQIIRTYQHGH